MKVGIVADSTFNLCADLVEKLKVEVVRLNILIESKSYTDGVDIDCDMVFDAIDEKKKVTTSQPSPEAFLNAYKKMIDNGYNDIIVFTVAKSLSGTYQSAVIAAEMIDANIKVVDTKTSAMGGDLLISEIGELLEEDISIEALFKKVDELVDNTKTLLTIDNMEVLYKSGRLSRAKAMIGSLLKVKPIMMLDKLGRIFVAGKVRTTRRVFDYIQNKIEESADKLSNIHIRISYIKTLENAKALKEKLQTHFQNAKIYICNEITPVLSVHLGKGGFGLVWLTK